MRNKTLTVFFARIANWQPHPFLCADGRGEPLSWWFYRRKFKHKDSCVERNWLGCFWSDFWWKIALKFN